MREFRAYILRCSDGSFYTGHTDNMEYRIAQHRAGLGSDWTRRRLPVELVWEQSFPTREEAKAAEFRIKPWSRAKKGSFDRWRLGHSFAFRPPTERTPLDFARDERIGLHRDF